MLPLLSVPRRVTESKYGLSSHEVLYIDRPHEQLPVAYAAEVQKLPPCSHVTAYSNVMQGADVSKNTVTTTMQDYLEQSARLNG